MGILLLLPFFLVRFGLLSLLNREAVRRAAYFAPMEGRGERIAYWLYQISNGAILIAVACLPVRWEATGLFAAGLAVYGAGLVLLILSVVAFAAPASGGVNQTGIYRLSRNPMYVAYFLYFLGCALLARSLVLLTLVLLFQAAAHWIILAEERWCLQRFGEEYCSYMKRVRRYL